MESVGDLRIIAASNAERLVIVRETDAGPRTCAEFAGPAALEHGINAGGKVALAPVPASASADVAYSEQVARLYEVGEILQFGHAMLMQLCVAYLDGAIEPSDYRKAIDNVGTSLETLLLASRQGVNPAEARAQGSAMDDQVGPLEQEVASLDQRLAVSRKTAEDFVAKTHPVLEACVQRASGDAAREKDCVDKFVATTIRQYHQIMEEQRQLLGQLQERRAQLERLRGARELLRVLSVVGETPSAGPDGGGAPSDPTSAPAPASSAPTDLGAASATASPVHAPASPGKP